MVDPRMAQATAVQTKIAMIAPIFFNIVICVSTLSAVPPTYVVKLALSSTFHCKVHSGEIRPGAGEKSGCPGPLPLSRLARLVPTGSGSSWERVGEDGGAPSF